MQVEFFTPTLQWEFYQNLHKDSARVAKIVNNNMNEALDYAERMLFLTQTGTQLKSQEYYSFLIHLCSISLSEEEYLEILSRGNNKEYVGFAKIKTTMSRIAILTEGHGHSFDYSQERIGTVYTVAKTASVTLDDEHFYTLDELKSLISKGEIIIIEEHDYNRAFNGEFHSAPEEYQTFPITSISRLASPTSRYSTVYYEYIKSQMNRVNILKIRATYLKELYSEVEDIKSFTSPIPLEQETAKACYRELTASGNIKKLQKLLTPSTNK